MVEFPEAQRDIFSSSVQQAVVVVRPGKKETTSGAGFILSASGLIITAAHVVGDSSRVRIKRCGLEPLSWKTRATGRYTADVIAAFRGADVAALRLRKTPKRLRPVNIAAEAEAPIGTAVLRVGNDDRRLASGHVIGSDRHNRYPTIKISMDTAPGASGGPLFSFHERSLLGMVIEYDHDRKMPGVGYALPIAEILRLIRQRKAVRELLPKNLRQ